MRTVLLALCALALSGCSTHTVTATTLRLYDPATLQNANPAVIEGTWGFFGKGVATAICGVDEEAFDPCVVAVALVPGEHTVDVRLILAATTIHRRYVIHVEDAGKYDVVPRKNADGFEEPVITLRQRRDLGRGTI